MSQRTYGGVTAEQRRAQRRATLLDAALELIGTDGFAALTVTRLCRQAGLNERYYYESFDSLQVVLESLFEDIVTRLGTAIVDAVAGAAPTAEAKAGAAIGAAIDLFTADPRRSRVAFVEGAANPELARRRTAIVRRFSTLVVAAGSEFYGVDTLPAGPELDLAATMLVGGLIETTTSWLAGDLALGRDELVDRVGELFVTVGGQLARRYGADPSTT